MKTTKMISSAATIAALVAFAGIVHAQETDATTGAEVQTEAEATTEAQAQTRAAASAETDALKGVEPVVPVGPAVVPVRKTVKQVGPAVVPVAPVEKFQGVETVTLDTERGPVVVVSFPGTVPNSAYNIDFTAIDSNDDGYISKAEVDAGSTRSEAAHNLALEFKIADDNADGRLAFMEILQWIH